MKGNCNICGRDLENFASISFADTSGDGIVYSNICIVCAKGIVYDELKNTPAQMEGGILRGVYIPPEMRMPVSQPNSDETGNGYGHE